MLLLDAQQAFDRVWHDGLIFKLVGLGFLHYLIGVIKSYLTDRSIRVRVGDSLSNPYSITVGVPQVSIISPCLFNIYCHDIPRFNGILTAQYADVAILRSTPQKSFCTMLLNKHVSILLRWYEEWRVAINESKSIAVFFSKKHWTKPQT